MMLMMNTIYYIISTGVYNYLDIFIYICTINIPNVLHSHDLRVKELARTTAEGHGILGSFGKLQALIMFAFADSIGITLRDR